jgi:tetratricopeptide (TPR) repeat protein
MRLVLGFALAALLAAPVVADDGERHDHPTPEKLGRVSFATSCAPEEEASFDRAVALLHSFAYAASRRAFVEIAARDPHCAMAYWGIAMTRYHQLWEPQVDGAADLTDGAIEIGRATKLPNVSPRERGFIDALARYYADADHVSPADRAKRYSVAMERVARANRGDEEAQIFYALSLIGVASPFDKTHADDKRAVAILAPIWKRRPDHPGLAHYLIHANDSAELAPRGLAAARAYSKIAPSAPHALHMPSHIFTRLGLWSDSITSNRAARAAARAEEDAGEELHAMDYLTYAYLQLGRVDDAAKVVGDLRAMGVKAAAGFKVGYAATAMPVRLAVETKDWDAARAIEPLEGSPPKVAAIVWWARALGHARGKAGSPDADIAELQKCLDALHDAGDVYWATQVEAMLKEAKAWRLATSGDGPGAIALMRSAADQEDSVEKLPVTPGPVVPAREQLGELLLGLNRPHEALIEFRAALKLAPGRRGALLGEKEARGRLGPKR